MKTQTRYLNIDFIRAVGTIGVIITHILALHLGTPLLNMFWNYIHFVVVGFIFCSSYVYWTHPTRTIVKRLLRLYMPFVVYLGIHYTLWFLFPSWFRGFGLQKSFGFIVASLTLVGGVDIGWLPLLFIQLALVAPFLYAASRHPRARKTLLMSLGILTFVTIFWRIPTAYSRAVAWIPWSFIALASYMYAENKKRSPAFVNKLTNTIAIVGILTWYLLYQMLSYLGQSLTLTIHKYPPDLFYLSYGIAVTAMLLLVYEKFKNSIVRFKDIITLTSKRAYMIFFVHYIFIDLITTRTRWFWWQEAIVITSLSLLAAYLWEYIQIKILSR